MNDAYVRDEPADEVLDLYDALPERSDEPREEKLLDPGSFEELDTFVPTAATSSR